MTQLAVQRLPAALRNEHHMVFALAHAMAQTLQPVHRGSSFVCLAAHDRKSLRWTPTESSNFYCLPGRAGGTLNGLGQGCQTRTGSGHWGALTQRFVFPDFFWGREEWGAEESAGIFIRALNL